MTSLSKSESLDKKCELKAVLKQNKSKKEIFCLMGIRHEAVTF